MVSEFEPQTKKNKRNRMNLPPFQTFFVSLNNQSKAVIFFWTYGSNIPVLVGWLLSGFVLSFCESRRGDEYTVRGYSSPGCILNSAGSDT